MNFAQVVDEVVSTIKRPDLIGQVRREVNAAISFYCLDNTFASDFVEQSVPIDPQQYTQAFAKSTLARFRKFKYIKIGGTKSFLSKLSDAEILSGCFDSKNSYYEIGVNVNISINTLAPALDVGFYAYPPILANTDEFWLLDIAPFMVIDRACATMFRSIGDEKSMQTHAASARDHYTAARKDFGISTQ
jgi:hypothetical protein